MKHKYEIIIHWSSDDNAFIAEAPELTGCRADGSNYDEAVKNIQVVIDEWIETAKFLKSAITEPRGKLVFA
jgi:predicted RNase H-like HicB family nuclease